MAPVALLRPLSDRFPSAPALSPEQALDLAVIGIAGAAPLPVDHIVDLLQRIAAPHMHPTADVIEGRLRELACRGQISLVAGRRGSVAVLRTAAGLRHLCELLRRPMPPRGAAYRDLLFVMKASLLDLLAADERASVIAGLHQDLQAALAAAEHAVCRSHAAGPFVRRWLERQVARLRDDLLSLDGLADGADVARPVPASIPPCPSGR